MLMNPIAERNDLMRKTFMGCRVVMTLGVSTSPENIQSELMEAIQTFSAFNEDNDPHAEHDFGKVICSDGSEFFWKFDYYDDDYKYFKEDGNRVLTIMKTDEY